MAPDPAESSHTLTVLAAYDLTPISHHAGARPSAGRSAFRIELSPTRAMRLPKAAWWVLAPLSWVWQYLVYVPAHWLMRGVLILWIGLVGDPIDRLWEDRKSTRLNSSHRL